MFLKNKNIIFKIRRSKVTDYAALRQVLLYFFQLSKIEFNRDELQCRFTSSSTFSYPFLFVLHLPYFFLSSENSYFSTAVPTKSDSDIIFCLQLLSKTLPCTLHLS